MGDLDVHPWPWPPRMPEPTDPTSQYKVLWGRRAAISRIEDRDQLGVDLPARIGQQGRWRVGSVQGPHLRPVGAVLSAAGDAGIDRVDPTTGCTGPPVRPRRRRPGPSISSHPGQVLGERAKRRSQVLQTASPRMTCVGTFVSSAHSGHRCLSAREPPHAARSSRSADLGPDRTQVADARTGASRPSLPSSTLAPRARAGRWGCSPRRRRGRPTDQCSPAGGRWSPACARIGG